MLIFIQEHWLRHLEANHKFLTDFKSYNFLTNSSDMFDNPEDMISPGTAWHGSAIGWIKSEDIHITKLPIIQLLLGSQTRRSEQLASRART